MNRKKVAQELVRLAKELIAADTFKCPNCGTKVLEQTGYCVKCKKKVKKAGVVPGVPDGTGPYGGRKRLLDEECPFDDDDNIEMVASRRMKAADVLSFTVPLLIRIMEYSKEDAETDMDLHVATENMIRLGEGGTTLTMDNYDEIVGGASGD